MDDDRPPEHLPPDEQFVLCWWSVQALAEELKISEDAAEALLEAAYHQGRIQILGNDMFAGVQCDGRWLVVEGRANLTRATQEWVTLRELEKQLGQ